MGIILHKNWNLLSIEIMLMLLVDACFVTDTCDITDFSDACA